VFDRLLAAISFFRLQAALLFWISSALQTYSSTFGDAYSGASSYSSTTLQSILSLLFLSPLYLFALLNLHRLV
jgi:hypothetical protein